MNETSATKRPSLKLNAASNWATMGVNIVLGLLLTPFIMAHVGEAGWGIWILIGSLLGYYGLLNLGIGSALARYVARYAGRGDEASLNRTASTAMMMFCLTGTLVAGVSLLVAEPLALVFRIEAEHVQSFCRVVLVLGLATGIGFPSSVLRAIVAAHEKFVVVNCVQIGVALSRAALVVVLLVAGCGLQGVALATLGSQLASLAVNYLVFKRCTPKVRIRPALASWGMLRALVVYGGFAAIITVADIIRTNLDSIVIGRWVEGISAVGVYGIAVLVKRYVFRVVSTAMSVLGPRFAALDGAEEHTRARALLLRSLAVSGFLSFGGCMMAVTFGGHFIKWWVPQDLAERYVEAIPVLWVLAIGSGVALSQNPAIVFMYAVNKHRFYAFATIIEAVANLVLSILLVTKYGILGVALGTMIPLLISKILVMPAYVSKIAGLSIVEYVRPIVPSALAAAVLILVAYSLGVITGETMAPGRLAVAGTVMAALYAAVSYRMMTRRYGRIL